MRYRITSEAGAGMGVYEAGSREQAVEMMYQDAGYASSEHAADTLQKSKEALLDELTIEEITASEKYTVEWKNAQQKKRGGWAQKHGAQDWRWHYIEYDTEYTRSGSHITKSDCEKYNR